jgi:hypothetical protein
MAHNIAQKMVYSFLKPMWHALTKPSLVPMTAVSIMKTLWHGGYEMRLEPVTVNLNGVPTQVNNSSAIVRGAFGELKDEVFAYVSDIYKPLQPMEIAQSYDDNVREPAETMAILNDGREMFISWKMPSFDVQVGGKSDQIDMYGIVRAGFDTMVGTSLMTSTYRPICANTLAMAQNWANANTDVSKRKGNVWKGKATNHNLLRDLGYWMEHVQENAKVEALLTQQFFAKLADTPVQSDEQVKDLIFEAFPSEYDNSAEFPRQLSAKKRQAVEEANESKEKTRDGIFTLFAGSGTGITPDFYGVLNATTEYFCHVQPSKRPIAQSVMFGNRQAQSMQMVKVLANYAG